MPLEGALQLVLPKGNFLVASCWHYCGFFLCYGMVDGLNALDLMLFELGSLTKVKYRILCVKVVFEGVSRKYMIAD